MYTFIQNLSNNKIYTQLIVNISITIIGLNVYKIKYLFTRKLKDISWQRGNNKRNNINKPLIIVADSHWTQNLTSLYKIQEANPNTDWLFIGDIFDIWVGTIDQQSENIKYFLNWVETTRKTDNWVGFWLGNREFFLDHLSNKFDFIGEGIGGHLLDEGLYWEHGELINDKDWQYRLFFLIFKGSLTWLITQFLPITIAHKLAIYLKLKVSNTNMKHKTNFPQVSFLKAAKGYKDGKFITGHFHIYKKYHNAYSLPWAKNDTFMVWHNREIYFLK